MQPKRPCSIYNLFYQMEREFVLHDLLPERANDNLRQIEAEQHAGKSISVSCDVDERPARYRGLVLASNWFKSGQSTRKHRKTNSPIGFHELNQLVSKRWKGVDEETKQYLKRITEREWDNYREEHKAFLETQELLTLKEKQEQEQKEQKKEGEKQTKEELQRAVNAKRNGEITPFPPLVKKGRSSMIRQELCPPHSIPSFPGTTMHPYPYCVPVSSFQQDIAASGNHRGLKSSNSFHHQVLQDGNFNRQHYPSAHFINDSAKGAFRFQSESKHNQYALTECVRGSNNFLFTQEKDSHPSNGKNNISRMLGNDENFQARPTYSRRYAPDNGNKNDVCHTNGDVWAKTNDDMFVDIPAISHHPQDQYRKNENGPPSTKAFPMASSHRVIEPVHSQQWDRIHNNSRSNMMNHAQEHWEGTSNNLPRHQWPHQQPHEVASSTALSKTCPLPNRSPPIHRLARPLPPSIDPSNNQWSHCLDPMIN